MSQHPAGCACQSVPSGEGREVVTRFPLEQRLVLVPEQQHRWSIRVPQPWIAYVLVFECPQEPRSPDIDDSLLPPLRDAAAHPQPDHVQHQHENQHQLGERRPPGYLDDVDFRGCSEAQ